VRGLCDFDGLSVSRRHIYSVVLMLVPAFAALGRLAMTDDLTCPKAVGLIGFGAFGRLIAQHLAPLVQLRAYDEAVRSLQNSRINNLRFVSVIEAANCSVVILAVPVNRMEETVRVISPHLKPGSLVLDVGSVKVTPADIMQRGLPPHVDVIATHPLFGPQSAVDGIRGLKIAVCPIRGTRFRRVVAFLRMLGLEVIVTTPDEHDREAATVQGLTHLIAKVLVQMEPLPTRMTTRSFDLLMQAVGMVRDDAPEVFQAIESVNPHSREVRRQFFDLAARLNAKLENGSS
jgi:prephenate dehydrogenase